MSAASRFVSRLIRATAFVFPQNFQPFRTPGIEPNLDGAA
jgi:hypothetical protein